MSREHIQIDKNRWENTKAHTTGGALEFLNYLHQESWLKTLERFDTTGSVEKVRKVADEVSPTFRAFYLPSNQRKQEGGRSLLKVNSLGFKLSAINRVISVDQVSISAGGRLKLRSQENQRASITLHKLGESWMCRSARGVDQVFFKKIVNPKKPLLVFDNPITFLGSNRFLDRLAKNQVPANVIVPLKPIDQFLKDWDQQLRKFPKVTLVRSKEDLTWGKDQDLRCVGDDEIRKVDEIGLAYQSIDELLRDLILGRSRE